MIDVTKLTEDQLNALKADIEAEIMTRHEERWEKGCTCGATSSFDCLCDLDGEQAKLLAKLEG